MNKAALIILDGWGETVLTRGNAVLEAHATYFNRLLNECPRGTLRTDGLFVGLPEGQMGNSEVGHMNIGAGRVIYQPLTRISKDLTDGTLEQNESFQEIFRLAKVHGRRLHILGLISDGGVHSHIEHVKGILEIAKREEVVTYVHAFMDGRDTPPTSGAHYLEELNGPIATVSGRYYAMDRDNRWERIKESYDAIVYGKGERVASAVEGVKKSYEAGVTDEFIKPFIVDPEGLIRKDDVVFFINFRPDRAREITRALTQPDFNEFPHEALDLHYFTMTEYDHTLQVLTVIYPPKGIENTLGEYLSNLGLKQFRIAETEKYAHVTFFFNGGREEPFVGEERRLIPSPKVATYDLQPEMSAEGVKNALVEALKEERADFYLCNFANPDMVGHTGVFEAAVQAIKKVDACLEEIVECCKEKGISVIITADHGNAEEMIDESGNVLTSHSLNPVPFLIVGETGTIRTGGKLADIAPTVLDLMDIQKPEEMTGESLLRRTK
ncbi:2,3-bisphosphoglycerate-independent phosphoglycerate mutase [Guggenheimella bovis]